jgi:hypothetical protein
MFDIYVVGPSAFLFSRPDLGSGSFIYPTSSLGLNQLRYLQQEFATRQNFALSGEV